jgi:hypothetical protein
MNIHVIACLGTWVLDYGFFLGVLYFAERVYPAGGPEQLTLFRHAVFLYTWVIGIAQLREFIYATILPSSIVPKIKTKPLDATSFSSIVRDQLSSTAILVLVSWILGVAGLTYWEPLFSSSFLDTFWRIEKCILEAYVIWLLKDAVSMNILHRLIHQPKFWWIHKRHHTYTKVMSFHLAASFDVLDIFIENAAGLALWVPIKWWLFSDSKLHLATYLIGIWFDFNTHSLNPYTAALVNPVLDWVFRVVVSHQLHHAVINDYFTLFPGHHILPGMRNKDLELYDQLFNTEISK